MPVRVRRTFTLFPGVKANVSKGGMSITVGRKGFHLNFSKHGVRQTTRLPGSGISHTSYLYKNDDDEDKKNKAEERSEANTAAHKTDCQRTCIVTLGFLPIRPDRTFLYLLWCKCLGSASAQPGDRFP